MAYDPRIPAAYQSNSRSASDGLKENCASDCRVVWVLNGATLAVTDTASYDWPVQSKRGTYDLRVPKS